MNLPSFFHTPSLIMNDFVSKLTKLCSDDFTRCIVDGNTTKIIIKYFDIICR